MDEGYATLKENKTKDPEKKMDDPALKAGKSESNKNENQLDDCWS